MPKMKSNRSAAKRFRLTGTGKLVRRKPMKGHLLTSKPRKRKRKLRQATLVSSSETRRIKRMLGRA
jgi:large subunit ribosomal protein L35